MHRRNPQIGKVALAGFTSGLIAAWAMNQFQAALNDISHAVAKENTDNWRVPEKQQEESEDATMKAAEKISCNVFHRGLSKRGKKTFGPVVHYAFGGAMGAVYAVAAEFSPAVTRGFGTSFATTLFAIADEMAVPIFGLSKGPQEVPFSSHASAWLAHLAYGVSLETARRISMAVL